MWLKKLGFVVGLSSLVLGCGPDCESTCEKAQEDGNCYQEVDGDDRDCEALCEDVEEIADEDNGDCEEELDELIDCMNDEDDACEALENSCSDEDVDLRNCLGDYCAENPSNDHCEDIVFVGR